MAILEELYLNRAKFVMKLLGVWLPNKYESYPKKIYRSFMILLQYLFLIFQMIYIIFVWGDLDAVSQASYLLFTQACLCFKITVFQIKTDELRILLEFMRAEVFQPKCYVHENILKLQASRIKRFLLAFMISSQLTCGLWALKPLFDNTGIREFPFNMWMPVSTEKSPDYEIGYAFQLITICMSAYMYFGVDSVSLSMVIFSSGQIDVVKEKLLSINPIKNGYSNVIHVEKLRQENYKRLVECIAHYQAILRFTHLVENAYHTYLFFQLTGSVGLICMSALRLLVVDYRSIQFFSIVTYLLVMISQLFTVCWCGHELTASSADLHTTLYKCMWYEQDLRFRRDLHFMMMRVSQPMVLKAGHYITLSRQTFVAILRMSYSYFAVLNSTNN